VAAVRDGRFSIFPVATIADGIETLTGVPAGTAAADGTFPPDTVYGRVQATLRSYLAQAVRITAYRHHIAEPWLLNGADTIPGGTP